MNVYSKAILTGCILIFVFTKVNSQRFEIFLIGDGGENEVRAIDDLKTQISNEDTISRLNKLTVFLGDNVYPNGVKTTKEKYVVLEKQLEVLKHTRSKGYFVPGNHDWMKGKRGSYKRVKNQHRYLSNHNEVLPDSILGSSELLPNLNSPGPAVLEINNNWIIIFIDSQWFLHGNKVTKEKSKEDQIRLKFWNELDSILSGNKDKNILLTAHHPLQSVGGHGKKKIALRVLLNSLGQVLSTVLLRSSTPYHLFSQDIQSKSFQKKYKNNMINVLNKYLTEHKERHVIYAAGHEHNLQYWKSANPSFSDRLHFIISGAGSKKSNYKMKLKKHFNDKDNVNLQYPYDASNVSLGFFRVQLDGKNFRISVRNSTTKEGFWTE